MFTLHILTFREVLTIIETCDDPPAVAISVAGVLRQALGGTCSFASPSRAARDSAARAGSSA